MAERPRVTRLRRTLRAAWILLGFPKRRWEREYAEARAAGESYELLEQRVRERDHSDWHRP